MPFVRLTLNDPDLPQETVAELSRTITDLLAQDLAKIARITVLQINLVARSSWFIGAEPVTGIGGHLEVSVSTGFNTDADKRAFVDHAYTALQRVLGELAPIFYTEVHEIPGLSWGYNGVLQGERRVDTD